MVFCGILDEDTVKPRAVLLIRLPLCIIPVVVAAFASDCNLPPKFGSRPNIDVSNDVSIVGQEETFTKSPLWQSPAVFISLNLISYSGRPLLTPVPVVVIGAPS